MTCSRASFRGLICTLRGEGSNILSCSSLVLCLLISVVALSGCLLTLVACSLDWTLTVFVARSLFVLLVAARCWSPVLSSLARSIIAIIRRRYVLVAFCASLVARSVLLYRSDAAMCWSPLLHWSPLCAGRRACCRSS